MSFCCNYANALLYQNIIKLLTIYIMLFNNTNHARTARCFIHKEKRIWRESLIGQEKSIVHSYKLLA